MKTKPAYDLTNLIDWLGKQEPNRQYNYISPHGCLLTIWTYGEALRRANILLQKEKENAPL